MTENANQASVGAGGRSIERVVVVPEAVAFGGAERSVLALCRWLNSRSIPCRVLLYRDQIGLAGYAGYPLQTTELAPGSQARQKIAALRHYFAAAPRDAPRPLMSGIQAALHASVAGIRGFHTLMHDTPSLLSGNDGHQSLRAWLRRRVSDIALGWGLRSGGRTIVTSEYLERECRQLYGIACDIVRMGGARGDKTFRPRVVRSQLRMLSVSRVEHNKRLDWILRGLSALENRDPPLHRAVDWHLDVVGGGSAIASLRDEANRLGLGERVTFREFVDEESLARAYDAAHLFIMPARQGYGIPAVEALYRGIPVLVHRDSGVSDILRDNSWCVVMEGGESEMASALEASIRSILEQRHIESPLPAIPTEDEWAETVARLCGWVP